MRGYGMVVSFELGSRERAERFLAGARLVTDATSFGSVHTSAERRARWGGDAVPEGFIRLSAGCEETADLLADMEQCARTRDAARHRRNRLPRRRSSSGRRAPPPRTLGSSCSTRPPSGAGSRGCGPSAVIHTAYRQDEPRRELRGRRRASPTAAARVGARLIHISTDLVFDGTKGEPYTEDDKPNPLDDYGRSKLEAERRVLELHPGALVVRTSLLVGRERARAARSRPCSRPRAGSARSPSSRTSGARPCWSPISPRHCSSWSRPELSGDPPRGRRRAGQPLRAGLR